MSIKVNDKVTVLKPKEPITSRLIFVNQMYEYIGKKGTVISSTIDKSVPAYKVKFDDGICWEFLEEWIKPRKNKLRDLRDVSMAYDYSIVVEGFDVRVTISVDGYDIDERTFSIYESKNYWNDIHKFLTKR